MRRDALGPLLAALALLATACGNANYVCVGICSSSQGAFDGTISASSAQDAQTQCLARLGCSPALAGSCTCIQE